ncbi:MAG TPA: protease inhibitor I42 family protein [Victivallales bacterium]|nr:protease inhibitor I42 family protein [Victivallales bacterium]
MKKYFIAGSLLVLVSTILVSCCCIFPKSNEFKADDSDKTFKGKTGETFTILLKSNPTTGYDWHVGEYDKKIIELVKSKYTPNSKLIGAGGSKLYTFKILATGKANLKFDYKRAWEKVQPLRTFKLNIVTKK